MALNSHTLTFHACENIFCDELVDYDGDYCELCCNKMAENYLTEEDKNRLELLIDNFIEEYA